MTIEEIVCGESRNTELKEMLPKDSEKYTKTLHGHKYPFPSLSISGNTGGLLRVPQILQLPSVLLSSEKKYPGQSVSC